MYLQDKLYVDAHGIERATGVLNPSFNMLAAGGIVSRASLRFEKSRENIDSFRGFIVTFSLFSNQSEALIVSPIHDWISKLNYLQIEKLFWETLY